jgi:hypothetical protein
MIKDGLQLIGNFIVDQLIKVLDDQGHRNTGKLQESLRPVVTQGTSGWVITIYGKDYAKYVDRGIPSGVWVSPYALAEWVEQKGIATGEKEIKNIAFAIRQKIFQEGSPTKGSLKFSNSGKRDDFIQVMLDENANVIFQMVFDLFSREVAISLRNTIAKQIADTWNRQHF